MSNIQIQIRKIQETPFKKRARTKLGFACLMLGQNIFNSQIVVKICWSTMVESVKESPKQQIQENGKSHTSLIYTAKDLSLLKKMPRASGLLVVWKHHMALWRWLLAHE